MNKNEVAGTVQKLAGRAESSIGDAVGDNQASASGRIRELKGDGQSLVGQAKEQAGEAAARAAEFAHDVYADPPQFIQRGQGTVAAQFNQNPFLTVVVAAAAGLFLGVLIGRNTA